ncbi:MAG: TRAP transporter small permease [Paracoccaceae bacterium]
MRDLLLVRLPSVLAGICMLGGIGINFANVVGRYFFGAPIFWAEEAMIFLIIWAVFLGFVAVTAQGEHLKMDLLARRLPERAQAWLERLGLVLGVVVMLFLAWQSWASLSRLWRFDMRSIALDIPMVIPHAAVPVGFVLSAVAAALLLVRGRR